MVGGAYIPRRKGLSLMLAMVCRLSVPSHCLSQGLPSISVYSQSDTRVQTLGILNQYTIIFISASRRIWYCAVQYADHCCCGLRMCLPSEQLPWRHMASWRLKPPATVWLFSLASSGNTSKIHITGPLWGNSTGYRWITGGFPSQRASNMKSAPMSWCIHARTTPNSTCPRLLYGCVLGPLHLHCFSAQRVNFTYNARDLLNVFLNQIWKRSRI